MKRVYNFNLTDGNVVKFNVTLDKQVTTPSLKIRKRAFIKIVNILKNLSFITSGLESIGIDLAGYEEGHYEIIETLLSHFFNENQLTMIDFYINIPPEVSEEGKTFEIKIDDKTFEVELNNSEDLWNFLNKIK